LEVLELLVEFVNNLNPLTDLVIETLHLIVSDTQDHDGDTLSFPDSYQVNQKERENYYKPFSSVYIGSKSSVQTDTYVRILNTVKEDFHFLT
jgi:hypothetical protein